MTSLYARATSELSLLAEQLVHFATQCSMQARPDQALVLLRGGLTLLNALDRGEHLAAGNAADVAGSSARPKNDLERIQDDIRERCARVADAMFAPAEKRAGHMPETRLDRQPEVLRFPKKFHPQGDWRCSDISQPRLAQAAGGLALSATLKAEIRLTRARTASSLGIAHEKLGSNGTSAFWYRNAERILGEMKHTGAPPPALDQAIVCILRNEFREAGAHLGCIPSLNGATTPLRRLIERETFDRPACLEAASLALL